MIVFTSPSPAYSAACVQVAAELGMQTTLVEGTFAVALARVTDLLASQEVAAVVSVLGTAGMLRRSLAVPVVEVEVSDADILRALVAARQHGRRVAMFWYESAEYVPDFEQLGKLLGLDVFTVPLASREGIPAALVTARRLGACAVVVGATATAAAIEQMGAPAVLLVVGKPAITAAMLRCRYLLHLRQQDQESFAWLRAVMQSVGDGLLAFDTDGRLMFMNRAAERVLEMTEAEARRLISGPNPPEKLARIAMLLRRGGEQSENLYTLGRYQVMVSTRPSFVEDRHIGTVVSLSEVSRVQQLESRIRRALHDRGLTARYHFEDIIGAGPALQSAIAVARRFATVDYTVLLQGETGTGKEVFAQSIHNASRRAAGPFVAVNCGALPENLLESELFGYEEGAFTGARRGGKAGLFELAHGGTLFLDEVDKLPLRLQASLLRVLQELQVMRLGGDRMVPVDVRIIAATNRELWPAVEQGEFRMDLFFRLHVLRVRTPSLRSRPEDIAPLAEYFLHRHRHQGLSGELTPALLQRLMRYDWPGNVRELENATLRLMLLGEPEFRLPGEPEPEADPSHPPGAWPAVPKNPAAPNVAGSAGAALFPPVAANEAVTFPLGSLRNMQRQMALTALQRYGGSRAGAARCLGISRVTLWRWLRAGADTGADDAAE